MKKIFLTIDIECHDIKKENLYIYGQKKNKVYGLEKILQLCEINKIPLNCFLDIGEYKRYGKEYIINIINLIKKYNQTIYLHLHPNYYSGDDNKSYLWEYNYEEKKNIITEGFSDYEKFLGKKSTAFRVGRYGADDEMYSILSELGLEIIDLSYLYGNTKMCKSNNIISPINGIKTFNNVTVFGNTRYKSLSLFGRDKYNNLDVSETSYGEFVEVINNSDIEYYTMTLHSWNFINKYYFSKKYFTGNNRKINKFQKMINYSKKNGIVFSSLDDITSSIDELGGEIDLTKGSTHKILSIFRNFERFREIGKLSKKYFRVYFAFYIFISLIILTIGVFLCL